MFIPPINLPIEGVAHAKWLEKRALEQEKLNAEFRAFMARAGKETSAGARQTSVVNVKATDLKSQVSSFRGLPEGGWRGSTVSQDVEGRHSWVTPIGSVVPMYWIYLEEGDPRYDVSGFGSLKTSETAKAMLPAPLFEDDGLTMDWPPSWGDEWNDVALTELKSNNMPITLSVYLYPASDGQAFNIVLPYAVDGAPWSVIHVYNDASFDAVVNLTFRNSAPVYADTGAYVPDTRTLVPDEALVWKLDEAHDQGIARVAPFTEAPFFDYPTELRTATIWTDKYFWGEVAATRHCEKFTKAGALTVTTDFPPAYNGRPDSVRIGKVRASVATAPTGDDVLVDVKLDGVSILSTPLVIPDGSTTATVVPDVTNYSSARFGDAVVWLADAKLTVEVTQIGSTTPGSTLAVQVFYG